MPHHLERLGEVSALDERFGMSVHDVPFIAVAAVDLGRTKVPAVATLDARDVDLTPLEHDEADDVVGLDRIDKLDVSDTVAEQTGHSLCSPWRGSSQGWATERTEDRQVIRREQLLIAAGVSDNPRPLRGQGSIEKLADDRAMLVSGHGRMMPESGPKCA
jgi:hypothetical protein